MMLLASLFLAAAATVSVSENCTYFAKCPCGHSKRNFTLCAEKVVGENDVCKRFKFCETCEDFFTECKSCPSGRFGALCEEVTPRKLVRKKRQAGSCPTPETPESGLMRCRNRNRLCVARCKPGYLFEGEDDEGTEIILECRRRGWYPRSSFPRCIRYATFGCTDPGLPEGGDRLNADGNLDNSLRTFEVGESVIFTCSDSVLRGSSLITCESGGTWSAPVPHCVYPEDEEQTTCEPPNMDPNGLIVSRTRPMRQPEGSERYRVDSQITYGCKKGYYPDGERVIYCLSSGSWSDTPPPCKRPILDQTVRCINLGLISNGRVTVLPAGITVDKDGTYPGGTRLLYSCEDGYVLRGTDWLACEPPNYWSADPPSCVEECGFSKLEAIRKITHGTSTLAGEWPWMTAIAISRRNATNVVCGGALLNRRTVLTAAHCITEDEPYYILSFGKFYRRDSYDDEEVQVRRSSQITVHKDFKRGTYENDIALIRFQPSVRYTLRVLPVCLPTRETTATFIYPGENGYVTGWGFNENNLQTDELMMAHLPVQPNTKCTDSFVSTGIQDFQMLRGMMCAGFDEGHTATCRGDSGSPFVFQDPNTKRYTVEGCVSYSIRGSCGLPGRYTVFTKVSDYMPWIVSNMRRRFWEPINGSIINA